MKTKKIEELIINSLNELAKIANEVDGKNLEKEQTSKLIFPNYLNGKHIQKKRVSEQEARLLFIRELDKEKDDFYYSIETPTTKLYNFKIDKEAPKILPDNEGEFKGQSASFDLTIHNDNFERIHFIEFKNENVNTIKKDFLKLLCDNNKVNYLIHTIKRENKGTIPNICKKYAVAINYIFEKIDKKEHTNSTLKIFLFNASKNQYIQFEDLKIQKIKENELKYEVHQL